MVQCWSRLPEELIGYITKRLHSVEDIVRFGVVCRSWRAVTIQKRYYSSKLSPPWLMLVENESNENRGFYNISSNRVHHLHLPEAQGRRCWGSPHGWLVTIGIDLEIHLLNPLTRTRIRVPPQTTFPDLYDTGRTPKEICDSFIEKAVICSSPSSSSSADNCIVMAIYGELSLLAFAKIGDTKWTSLENCPRGFIDLIYSNGYFFALQSLGNVVKCEINGPHPKAIEFASPPKVNFVERKYLVELSGELHMVMRNFKNIGPYSSPQSRTTDFKIYKLDSRNKQWVEVESLGDRALFVGNNSTFAISVSDHPEFQSNCIYFTDDYSLFYKFGGGGDIGIFNYTDHTIQPCYPGHHHHHDIISDFSPPLWISPSLW
ncbi:putative F-box protein At5g55150 [Macadamia integrifolia]|uniref:putative F-box protein At5g55150 n=1 Tax=Macadamia integrifolia TaxID=60698 RepID=UPI001C52B3F0|nr:putative F-box protein At5g55150 [Macadamia integrifolia]